MENDFTDNFLTTYLGHILKQHTNRILLQHHPQQTYDIRMLQLADQLDLPLKIRLSLRASVLFQRLDGHVRPLTVLKLQLSLVHLS